MHRFFDAVTRPLLDASRPSVVVEVGSDRGRQTRLLADWCSANGAQLHVIDPLPKYDIDEWQAQWPDSLVFHRDLSLSALEEVGPADFVLIDGDHNWYTVFHELETLAREVEKAGDRFPIVMLHDVGWPYGRRDLYYDPETIPPASRHPHRRGGLSPSSRGLLERGFNDHLHNATLEGTPRNGVLTAVEDFVAQHPEDLIVRTLPGLHGLGILVGQEIAEEMSEVWADILGTPGLQRVIDAVERDRIERLQEARELRHRLGRARRQVVEVTKARDELERLRRRRSVRIALWIASLTRPVFRLRRRVGAGARQRRTTSTSDR